MRPKFVRAPSVAGGPPLPNMIGVRGEPEDRQLARMANARNVSGLHRLREVPPWPAVIGAGRGSGDRPLERLANARGLSEVCWLPEMRPWPEGRSGP